eukprot:TRINITY_DN8627_c0_g1_i1.p1 TRINITY_DN8627_c0_g1~~TRINITY_DN8627_c0_g1_i1.p1  ORF type:complete len:922 (+),score=166.65 TRINITY_DN8627_c0_g1_i1:796-3561(+)
MTWKKDYTLCVECFERMQNLHFCPVCNRAYDNDDYDVDMLECDYCKRWVHRECEGLSVEQYSLMTDSRNKYKCVACKDAQSREKAAQSKLGGIAIPIQLFWQMRLQAEQLEARASSPLALPPVPAAGRSSPTGPSSPPAQPEVSVPDSGPESRDSSARTKRSRALPQLLPALSQDPPHVSQDDSQNEFKTKGGANTQPAVSRSVVEKALGVKLPLRKPQIDATAFPFLFQSAQPISLSLAPTGSNPDEVPVGPARSDRRVCAFCRKGESPEMELLLFDICTWVHGACALYSSEVVPGEGGKVLFGVGSALRRSSTLKCSCCSLVGASVGCKAAKCTKVWHFMCARQDKCAFLDSGVVLCAAHALRASRDAVLSDPLAVVPQPLECSPLEIAVSHLFEPQLYFDEVAKKAEAAHLGPTSAFARLLAGHTAASSPRESHGGDGALSSIHDPQRQFHFQAQLQHSLATQNKPAVKRPWLVQSQARTSTLTVLSYGVCVGDVFPLFQSAEWVYPLGYCAARIFWSGVRDQHLVRDCFLCHIRSVEDGAEVRPVFEICAATSELRASGSTPSDALAALLDQLRVGDMQAFAKFPGTGEAFFGLDLPLVQGLLEHMPRAAQLAAHGYQFRYNIALNPHGLHDGAGRLVQATGALAAARVRSKHKVSNETGSARSEGVSRTASAISLAMQRAVPPQFLSPAETGQSFSKSDTRNAATSALVSSNPLEWPLGVRYRLLRSNPPRYKVMRSPIDQWGVFATADIRQHEMIIEYIGEIVRDNVADRREKRYEHQKIGCYMFRLDAERIVDATLCGNVARFINHSCNPNAYAKIVTLAGARSAGGGSGSGAGSGGLASGSGGTGSGIGTGPGTAAGGREARDGETGETKHIIIFAKRNIVKGEEIAYDYMLEFEEDKIPCMCGAPNCRKYLN